jgi:N-acetyl sugar amidotransferase
MQDYKASVNMEKRVCTNCIMDNINDPDLVFDEKGVCNHCKNYTEAFAKLPKGEEKNKKLQEIISNIKTAAKGKKYDAILGVSGGVDSTYLAYVAHKLGMKLLLIHCDNGWNSELSVQNIESIIKHTGFDLHTLVLDWEEFKDIQLSFFKAGVVDIELPYDYALIASIYKIAEKHGIRYLLSGHNLASEGTYLPKSWRQNKWDIINIKAIHQKFGTRKMKNFPHFSPWKMSYYILTKKFENIRLLDYIDYNKQEAKETIIREMGWRDYGGKHYESVFTRFYQGYILPEKFNIDKRQFHLSTLICSGQMTREQALEEIKKPIYPSEIMLRDDLEYVKKKLNFTDNSFKEYMNAPIHKHEEYPNINDYWKKYYRLMGLLKPFKFLLRPLFELK